MSSWWTKAKALLTHEINLYFGRNISSCPTPTPTPRHHRVLQKGWEKMIAFVSALEIFILPVASSLQQIKSSIYYLCTALWKGTLVWAQLGGSAAHMWLTYALGPSWEVGLPGMALCTLPSPAALIGFFPCWLCEADGAASPLSPGLECVHSHFCFILLFRVSLKTAHI